MKHLSLLSVLLISSSMVYAEWITKGTDYKGDCLEMICEHGCVENSDTLKGRCCPQPVEGTNCVSDTVDEYNCKRKKKICVTGQYCNTTSKTCQPIPTCPVCQKFDMNKGQCVADTSKNNQAVSSCGKCNNGSVITDATKETVCKTCNTSNWTLTNKANGTQVQDVCHMCKDGNIVLKDEEKNIPCDGLCCSKNQICNKGKCETPVPKISHWTFCGYPGWGIWEIHSGGPYSVDLVLKGELYYVDDILYVYVDGKQKFTHSSYNYGCLDSKCAKHWSVDIPKGAKWSVKLYNGGKNLACAPGKTWLELPK